MHNLGTTFSMEHKWPEVSAINSTPNSIYLRATHDSGGLSRFLMDKTGWKLVLLV